MLKNPLAKRGAKLAKANGYALAEYTHEVGHKITKRKGLLFIVACLFILVIYYKSGESDVMSNWKTISLDMNVHIGLEKQETRYLLNTSGCILELMEPFDERYPEIKKYFKRQEPFNCSDHIEQLTSLKNGKLRFETSVLDRHFKDLDRCFYRSFELNYKSPNELLYGKETPLNIESDTPIDDGFILVECTSKSGTTVYRHAHKQIVPKSQPDGSPWPDQGEDDYNLLFVGIESVSKNAFLRHCPDLHKYLTESLGAILLSAHNKGGHNTGPNVWIWLTGKTLTQSLPELFLKSCDDMWFVHKDFQKLGYVSQVLEDLSPNVDLPSYVRYFTKPPATHFDRATRLSTKKVPPITYANYLKYTDYEYVCYGTEPKAKLHLDFIKEFMFKYKTKKRLSFSFMDPPLGTHEDFNAMSRHEKEFMQFFKDLKEGGILDNTIVIFASDHSTNGHGGDYFNTFAGQYEDYLPTTYIILPDSFKTKYPASVENLKFNSQYRLTSHMDLHKTTLAISQKKFTPTGNINAIGLSLFERFPESRTCDDAGIEAKYCACGKLVEIERDHVHAVNAERIFSKFVVNFKSQYPQHYKCADIDGYEIIEAKVKIPSQDLILVLKMTPYSAILQVIFRISKFDKTNSEIEIISFRRLDAYAPMTKCLNTSTENETMKDFLARHTSTKLEVFCVCKDIADNFLDKRKRS